VKLAPFVRQGLKSEWQESSNFQLDMAEGVEFSTIQIDPK